MGFGITTGTIYYIPIYMGYLFFPNRKGLVVGCVLCGYGLSSFVFGMIFFSMVNPENLNPEKAEDGQFYFQGNSYSVVENIPQAIRYCCIIYTVLLYLGSSLVFYHPE